MNDNNTGCLITDDLAEKVDFGDLQSVNLNRGKGILDLESALISGKCKISDKSIFLLQVGHFDKLNPSDYFNKLSHVIVQLAKLGKPNVRVMLVSLIALPNSDPTTYQRIVDFNDVQKNLAKKLDSFVRYSAVFQAFWAPGQRRTDKAYFKDKKLNKEGAKIMAKELKDRAHALKMF